MANTILKAVLTELVESMNERNNRVSLGLYVDYTNTKIEVLRECLEMAGYNMHIVDEEIKVDNAADNCWPYCYTKISFDVPGASTEDIKAFQEAGFEWLWTSNVMKYEFAMNRKEES